MDNLTLKQHEILNSFRYTVADAMEPDIDDHFLLRFLIARNFNIEKAEVMFRKSMKWRRQMRIRNFLDHYRIPELFEKYHVGGLIGADKQGFPLWFINAMDLDVNGFLASGRVSDFVNFQVYRFELTMHRMKEQSEKLKKNIDKMVFVFDADNLAVRDILHKPVLEALMTTIKVFEANYPEVLRRCYILNVPKLFFVLFSLVKPLIGESTIDKIKIYGRDGWKEAVLETIDASVLPVHWGGTRVDPITGDPKCSSIINQGGIVPESFYMSRQKRLRDETDSISIIVPKKDHVDVAVKVNKIGSIIEWEVQTEENDLGIGLYYKLNEYRDQIEKVIHCTRAETCRIPERGNYKCEKLGIYFVRLDNSFSWFNEKKVSYRIRIVSSDEVQLNNCSKTT